MVGGVLVAAAGVGLFAVATSAGSRPTEPYVVAAEALDAGQQIAPGDLAVTTAELPADLRSRAFGDPAELKGATLLAPVGAGELLQASAVIASGEIPGTRELTFTVPQGRIGDSIRNGERVDVLATYSSGVDAYTVVVGRDLPVITADRTRVGVGETSPVFVTVAVADPLLEVALAHGAQVAELTVVRTTGTAPAVDAPTTYRSPGTSPPGAQP